MLKVQCADLTRSENDTKEAYLTLKFEFEAAIIPNGVALSDPERKDILNIFVVTANKALHTLDLPISFFRDEKAPQMDIRSWTSTFTPTSFTIDQPHFIYASNPYELFLSLESGRLQRLTRTGNEREWNWEQSNYDDRSWGASIRGIVSRRAPKPVQHGSRSLNGLTAHAVVAASDSTFVYTVCLNHTLRAWNLTTGKLAASVDLLNGARPAHEQPQLNPAEPTFVRLYRTEAMDHSILVTYTPLEGGQFKFWDVRAGLIDSLLIVEDKFPDIKLSSPDPDPSGNTIWSMTGFDIRPGSRDKPTELWVLWRNNNQHRLYSVHFDLHMLPEAWETMWVQSTTDLPNKANPPDLVLSEPKDATKKWMEFLFHPGRYPTHVLETALATYQDAMGTRLSATQRSKSLQERLCSSVASSTLLRKYSESDIDYERFASDTDFQWRNFWRIVENLSELRQAPLSLALDKFAEVPWVVMADKCCLIRECNKTELLTSNDSSNMDKLEFLARGRWPYRRISADSGEPLAQISALLKAASMFREQFSPELNTNISAMLYEDLWQETDLPVPQRITEIYDRCNLAEAIPNETFQQLTTALEHIGGGAGLGNELIFAALDTLPEKARTAALDRSALRTTIFGSGVLIAGLQDTICQGCDIVLDLLVLVVFLECEFNQEEKQLPELDAPEAYTQLLRSIREYEKNAWLVSHERLAKLEFAGASPAQNVVLPAELTTNEDAILTSIIYDTIGKDIRPHAVTDKPQSCLFTESLAEIESVVGGAEDISPEDGLVYIQCNLIAHQNIGLATDFLRFQPRSAWSTYVKGRLCVARSEHDEAAIYFRQAAILLASGKAIGMLHDMSAGLLSMLDVQYFFSGLSKYFQHILGLFETAGAFSYVADFAHLALEPHPGEKEPKQAFRSEILSRLFTAELKSSRFEPAFSALSQFSDQALQRSSLIALVNSMLSPQSGLESAADSLRTLQSLPLESQPRLINHIDNHLENFAKKQTSLPRSSGQLWSSSTDIDHLRILHAFRLGQGDYRGAVAVLFDRLKLVQKSSHSRNDPQATELRHTLLALINALSCVAPDEAYLLTEMDQPLMNGDSGAHKLRKRIIVTLDYLRKEYQQVLDKCSRIERGDFDFETDGQESEDEEDHEMGNCHMNGDAMEL